MEYTRENQHPDLNDFGGHYGYKVGRKYVSGQNITEIAKLIRQDIKASIKAGEMPAIKTSVTISRYSMGQSLTISVIETPNNIMSVERVAFELKHPSNWNCQWDCPREQYTAEGRAILDVLAAIMRQYNYDRSDSQTDYYDVNFSGSVNFDWRMARTQREAIEAELAGGNAPTLSVTLAPEMDLAPVIAGPARVVAPVVNEEAARFAFFLGLE